MQHAGHSKSVKVKRENRLQLFVEHMCAPFVGSDGREDTHHGACDAARVVAAEAGNERQRRRKSEQKVTMASVLGSLVVGERRVLGCESPRPADTHSRGTVDG